MSKKLVLTEMVLVILMNSFTLLSCSNNDDDSPVDLLIGTWYIEKYDELKGGKYTEMEFNADKTFYWREFKTDRVTLLDSFFGTYQVNDDGNTIYTYRNGRQDNPYIMAFRIVNNNMITKDGTWYRK